MFLHFGHSERLLNYYEDESAVCDNCGEKALTYRIVQKYYQIQGIPFLPAHKYTGVSCENCMYGHNNVISENAKRYEKLSKTPLYLYSGALVLSLTFLSLIVLACLSIIFPD
ncbi:hypothetical protein [Pedobacter punctiformis]|uniref:Zinc-ribbon 15 domain-containing protein n=1 Tax=Pedobacter punctiformis TaxID=3004097 RepID=A0ABT4LAV7_9SPHI|nr:hypothetical protein [Pedobacter sp. HCMS5-2]MCZ4245056.1 hypothetical protein [Pedobacter sp. HCMS5-2]